MKHLFPIEITENTVQSHWTKRHVKSKIIYWIILIIVISTCVSLPFIYVDVTTQSRGVVRTPNENNNIQTALYGEVVKISIFENKTVNSGDTLIWLQTAELDEQIERLKQKEIENQSFITDIDILLRGSSQIQTPKYKAEKKQYWAKISEQDIMDKQAENEYWVSKTLYEKGVEAKYEHQQADSKYKTTQSQLSLLKKQQYSTWQTEKTRLEYENKDINSELLQLEKRKSQYTIIAPISGNIVQFTGVQTGNFLSPGQSVAQITTTDSLLVECFISPSDIGYIDVGQTVKFQMDAFNYQQWGLLHGITTEIISDIIEVNNQPFFRVRCAMDKNYLELSNGYRGNLKKGMSTTARFFLTRRSLGQLLFDEIDNWINPKIIDNGNKN